MLAQGITFDYAQLLIDNEIARMIQEVVGGITVNKDALALEVIQSVGAAGEFVSHEHTYTRFRDIASQNKLIYRGTRDAWQHAGSKDMTTRAYEEAKQIFDTFKVAPLPADVVQKMRAIINEAEDHLGVKISSE